MSKVHSVQVEVNNMHAALRRFDMNLLLVFEALYRRGSVVAAADELAISPSACSHALARLREALADDLFLRVSNKMVPSPVAKSLINSVAEALSLLSDGLGAATTFDPMTSQQHFVFAATDYTVYVVLTPLIAELEKAAPGIRIAITYLNRQECRERLKDGRVHFVIDARHTVGDDLGGCEILDYLTDSYVVAHRKGHPRLNGQISFSQYLAEKHIAALPWSDTESVIDGVIHRHGYRRDVTVTLPSVLAAPYMVATTDYLFTLPMRAATLFKSVVPITLCSAPFDLPKYTLSVISSPRYSRSAAHLWLREKISSAFESR